MNKVVVSVDGSAPSKAAVRWCAKELEAGTTVIAVCGTGDFGEFVVGMPPFDVAAERGIEECFEQVWCAPLRDAGLACEPRFVHCGQATAVAAIVCDEKPDALVIGKAAHHALTDLILEGGLDRLIHQPVCPVVLVPVAATPS